MRLAEAIEHVAGELAHPHLHLGAAGSLRPALDNRNLVFEPRRASGVMALAGFGNR